MFRFSANVNHCRLNIAVQSPIARKRRRVELLPSRPLSRSYGELTAGSYNQAEWSWTTHLRDGHLKPAGRQPRTKRAGKIWSGFSVLAAYVEFKRCFILLQCPLALPHG
jgi:hypothetical protein